MIRPEAETTYGSFDVSAPAMAKVIRTIIDHGLQVVGQVHTHPGEAYHSGGDEEGAKIVYSGYVSIVLPDYGRHLPSFGDAALFMYIAPTGFVSVPCSDFTVIPGRLS
jgi:proteasome lid subunit RPN8/RPN11